MTPNETYSVRSAVADIALKKAMRRFTTGLDDSRGDISTKADSFAGALQTLGLSSDGLQWSQYVWR